MTKPIIELLREPDVEGFGPARPNALAHREAWLHAMRDRLRPHFEEAGATIPDNVRLSCGFPGVGALRKAAYRNGECWGTSASKDETFEIFLSPRIPDQLVVAAVLVHELIHAAVGIKAGHGKPFGRVARKLGLIGKLTATEAGPELIAKLQLIVEAIGPYPHAEMDVFEESSGPKKQKGRLLKATCGECEYTVRVTKKWAERGAPICPGEDGENHGPMDIEWPIEDPEEENGDNE